MWTLLGVVGLLVAFLFWSLSHGEPEQASDKSAGTATSTAVNPTAEIRVEGNASVSIRFKLTKLDMCFGQMGLLSRNRVIRVLILLGLVFLEYTVFSNMLPAESLWPVLLAAVVIIALFLGVSFVLVFGVSLLLAVAFKHRGLIGEHVIEITPRGLLESTEFNENLAKWPCISRIQSTRRYLYIYVSDMQAHIVPKHGLSSGDIAAFEAALRAHAKTVS